MNKGKKFIIKIKDDVDLKELENFGFVHEDETEDSVETYEYKCETEESFDVCRVVAWNRKVWCIGALDKFWDITNAGFVEKIEK